jgi:hypothetical protein
MTVALVMVIVYMMMTTPIAMYATPTLLVMAQQLKPKRNQ